MSQRWILALAATTGLNLTLIEHQLLVSLVFDCYELERSTKHHKNQLQFGNSGHAVKIKSNFTKIEKFDQPNVEKLLAASTWFSSIFLQLSEHSSTFDHHVHAQNHPFKTGGLGPMDVFVWKAQVINLRVCELMNPNRIEKSLKQTVPTALFAKENWFAFLTSAFFAGNEIFNPPQARPKHWDVKTVSPIWKKGQEP